MVNFKEAVSNKEASKFWLIWYGKEDSKANFMIFLLRSNRVYAIENSLCQSFKNDLPLWSLQT